MAYGLRCALTNLPLVELLEAAHIVADSRGALIDSGRGFHTASLAQP